MTIARRLASFASAAGPTRLVWAIVLGGTLLRLLVAPSYGYFGVDADLLEPKETVQLALTEGVARVYVPSATNDPALTGTEWGGGYFTSNPPLIIYMRVALGAVYRWFDPQSIATWDWHANYFELDATDLRERLAATRGFTVLLKLPGIIADAGITLLLAWFAAGLGPRLRLAAAAAYAFNPAVIFNTAFWGEQDAVWILFLIGSVFALSRSRTTLAWVAFTLACLTKPQAWAFAPLIVGVSLVRAPRRDLVRAAAAAAAVTAVCFLPFWWHGTLAGAYAAIFRSTIGGEPFVSCNAANLWWLVTGGNGYDVADTIRVAGPVTLRLVGIVACVGTSVIVARRLAPGQDDLQRMLFGAAIVGMAFFLFATELHENHMASVIPLLAFAAGRDRRMWGIIAVLSGTHLANMALFDGAIAGPAAALLKLPQLPVQPLSLALAAINVAAFVMMIAIGRRRPAGLLPRI